jgi:YVTN family beta-propeller protein
MPRPFLGRILALGLALPATVFALGAMRPGDVATPTSPDQPHRSPIALALSADGSRLLTANHTAGTVSLVETTARKVLAEIPTGDRPMGVAISPDGKRGAVSHWYGYDLAILSIGPDSMKVVGRVEVGPEPRGVVLSPDGTTAYVAIGAAHEVVRVDLGEGKITGRVAVGTEPRDLEITQDGARLLVGNARSSDLSVVKTPDLTVERTLKVDGVNLRQVAIDPAGEFGYVANMRNRRMATVDRNIDLGWVLGQRLTRVSLDGSRDFATQTLDPQGKAAGDAHGVALSADGKHLAVSCGGTHEVMFFRTDLGRLPWRTGGSRDLIHASLLSDDGKFRRVETGGRPTELAFAPDGKTLYVANYLADSVQVLDADAGSVIGEIALGAPSEISLERRGEILFHAAERSFNQWYSCNTCHSDGHTNGENFDTKNDGWHDFSTTPTLSQKQVPTLRGVARTGPWTWHGWQTSLDDAVDESFTKSMQGKKPTPDETRAVAAFLSALDHPRNPNLGPDGSISEAARRGEALFRSSKAACSTCHPAPDFTDGKNHMIGLEERQDVYEGYNPPSLLGVYDTAPYLHDGRAATLHDVLAGDHSPEIAAGLDKLTDEEIDDLVAYLRTL